MINTDDLSQIRTLEEVYDKWEKIKKEIRASEDLIQTEQFKINTQMEILHKLKTMISDKFTKTMTKAEIEKELGHKIIIKGPHAGCCGVEP